MTIGEAILQGLGASIVATSSSTVASSPASITPPPALPSGDAGSSSITSLTDNYTLPFGNHSSVFGTQNPFEPAHWYTDLPELDAAKTCFSALTSYYASSAANFYTSSIQDRAWPIVNSTRTYIATTTKTTTIYPSNPSTYKLCDGSPRVDIKPQTSTSTSVITSYFTTTAVATPTLPVGPPCEGNAEMCYDWFRYSNLTNDWYTTNSTDSQLLERECGSPAHFDPATDNATHWPCLIAGGPVQLFYFPVDSDPNQGLCNTSRTPILTDPATTTAPPPSAVVTDGYTLTPGSVYVSFRTLYAYHDAFGGDHFGTTFADLLLPFASSEISTGCGGFGGQPDAATRLNYADLNHPVPASAYACQRRCSTFYDSPPPQCRTIWDDFSPQMQIPSRLTDLHPAWKTCNSYVPGLVNEWLFDPPIALTQATAPALLSLPGYAPAQTTMAGAGGGGGEGNSLQGVTRPSNGNGAPTWPTWPSTTTAQPAYDHVGDAAPTTTVLPTPTSQSNSPVVDGPPPPTVSLDAQGQGHPAANSVSSGGQGGQAQGQQGVGQGQEPDGAQAGGQGHAALSGMTSTPPPPAPATGTITGSSASIASGSGSSNGGTTSTNHAMTTTMTSSAAAAGPQRISLIAMIMMVLILSGLGMC